MLRSIGKQSRESVESVLKKKRKVAVGEDLQKWGVLSRERKIEGVMKYDNKSNSIGLVLVYQYVICRFGR